MKLKNKNAWGSASSNLDSQRRDLFRVTIDLPPALGGAGSWSNDIEFAIQDWPFPERRRQRFETKYLNQTNFQLGADQPLNEIDVTVRYAFNQPTIQLLEKWNYLTSNPRTGGVAVTSAIKAKGYFIWLRPNMSAQVNVASTRPDDATLVPGAIYVLEGCFITGLTPVGGDHTVGNEGVTYQFNLSIDRAYPEDINRLVVGTNNLAI